MQEQQILYPTDASFDNEVMNEPSSFEPSENNNIPKTFLPGHTLKSLNELKNHGFDPELNAPEFYWSEHKLSGSGVRNLTAKAFSLHTEQVSNAEARFSLTISQLLIQLTESQRELFAQCMLHAANSKHPQLSIFEHTRVPTSEDDFLQSMIMNVCVLCLFIVTTKCKAMRNIHSKDKTIKKQVIYLIIYFYIIYYIFHHAKHQQYKRNYDDEKKHLHSVKYDTKNFKKNYIVVRRQCSI